ncbi:esterase/lipase family protein [Burkholderia pseudomallei]|uniref:esterase/lipase family protein n=1 Tax=Burkholderia pseudomallei TaxID=28450 RepID=UPI000F0990C7|nr:endopeptidase [Burkholderia pseudomallei]VBP13379.1 Uncharacterised protein [Burkholderia pseudomallei]
MKLVFIHGRSQAGKDPDDLCRIWQEALDVGLDTQGLASIADVEVAFPYYGDVLADMVKRLRIESPSPDVLTKGVPTFDDKTTLVQYEMLSEILGEKQLDDPAEQAVHKGAQNSRLALAVARLLDASPFGDSLLRAVTEDVAVYLTNRAVSNAVNAIVKQAIGTQPCVVVAHSLGSVIAYRVLREMGAQANVKKFVTLGSPLGLSAVRNRLIPPVLAHPEGVSTWINAYDVRDVVSLYPLDRTTWDIDPPVININTVANHMDNRHGISGYLDNPSVAREIHESLRDQSELNNV